MGHSVNGLLIERQYTTETTKWPMAPFIIQTNCRGSQKIFDHLLVNRETIYILSIPTLNELDRLIFQINLLIRVNIKQFLQDLKLGVSLFFVCTKHGIALFKYISGVNSVVRSNKKRFWRFWRLGRFYHVYFIFSTN